MSHPLHHKHMRKRVHKNLEKYPHPSRYIYVLDHLIYVVGILMPFMLSLQSIKIWQHKNAESISLFTFCAMAIGNLIWLLYAFAHKEKPLIMTYILFFLVNLSIIIGTLLYG